MCLNSAEARHTTPVSVASHADVQRASSRVPATCGTGAREEPLRTFAWEATVSANTSLLAVFTLETDYSCETGYPLDNSRQTVSTS